MTAAIDIAPMLGDASGGASSAGYHQIADYLSCPKKFQYAKVRGIRQPLTGTPAYFAVGSMFHAARAAWFTTGFRPWEECRERLTAAILEVEQHYELPVHPSAAKDATRYMEEYVEHYLGRPHPKPLAAEYPIGPSEVGGEERTARLDDVSYYDEGGGKLWIGESKTTSTDIGGAVEEYTLHGQPMLQVLLWRASPQGAAMYGDVAGVMLDVLQKGYGGKRCTFARVPIEVTDLSLKWYERELGQAVRESKLITWDGEVQRRIASCTTMIGSRRVACPFRDLCRFGRDAALGYVTPDGKRLTDHEPEAGKERMPWE